jgi:ankyrin repeat protein
MAAGKSLALAQERTTFFETTSLDDRLRSKVKLCARFHQHQDWFSCDTVTHEMCWLIGHGASSNISDDRGKTALMHATEYCTAQVVKDMMLHHADPTLAQPSTGLTALHYAVKKKRHLHETGRIVRLLTEGLNRLESSALPGSADIDAPAWVFGGRSALHLLVIQLGHYEGKGMMYDALSHLIAAKADPLFKDDSGACALDVAGTAAAERTTAARGRIKAMLQQASDALRRDEQIRADRMAADSSDEEA